MPRGGRRAGAGRKAGKAAEIKHGPSSPLPAGDGELLAYDPTLRDSSGHLKPSVVADLDAHMKAHEETRRVLVARDHRGPDEDESDLDYLARKDAEAANLDEVFWKIPAAKRPPFTEFLKQRGYKL